MNWLKSYRTSYARLEYDGPKINKNILDLYRKTIKS